MAIIRRYQCIDRLRSCGQQLQTKRRVIKDKDRTTQAWVTHPGLPIISALAVIPPFQEIQYLSKPLTLSRILTMSHQFWFFESSTTAFLSQISNDTHPGGGFFSIKICYNPFQIFASNGRRFLVTLGQPPDTHDTTCGYRVDIPSKTCRITQGRSDDHLVVIVSHQETHGPHQDWLQFLSFL